MRLSAEFLMLAFVVLVIGTVGYCLYQLLRLFVTFPGLASG